MRLVARIPETTALFLEKANVPDEEVATGSLIDLNAKGLERLYSKDRHWELNVQGVVIALTAPLVVVKDALVKAGIRPRCWLDRHSQESRPAETTSGVDRRNRSKHTWHRKAAPDKRP